MIPRGADALGRSSRRLRARPPASLPRGRGAARTLPQTCLSAYLPTPPPPPTPLVTFTTTAASAGPLARPPGGPAVL